MKKQCRLFLLALGFYQASVAQTFTVPANRQWLSTSIILSAGEAFESTASGQWSNGGAQPQWIGPQGWPTVHIGSSVAPALPLSALVAKVGNQTFLLGASFKGKSPAAGELFLSMNDDNFTDNNGSVDVVLKLHRIVINNPFPRPSLSVIPAAKYLALLQATLSDGKIQLSQTGAGTPLSIKDANGSTHNSMSYLSFGTALNAYGVKDMDIQIPDNEYSPEQIQNTGGVSIFAQYLITHSAIFADRFRFLLNNIHGYFGTDLVFRLSNNEIQIDLSLQSPDPSIRGEGNGYTGIPFGIPIPLGWQDGLCPDINIKNFGFVVHLVPFVAADGTLHLNDPTVTPRGDISINNFDWLSFAQDIKNKFMNGFTAQIEAALRQPAAKKGLETGLLGLLQYLSGKPNTNLSWITIDNTGIVLGYKP